jgi:hypothetical protein
MKLAVRIAVALLCLIATIGSLSAIYADNSDVVRNAQKLACPDGDCVRMLEMERTPFAQRFVFQTSIEPLLRVDVKCERSLVLFGEYTCQVSGPPR